MTYGEYRRAKPRLKVLRGYGGNESNVLSTAAAPKLDEAIKSGMLITLDTNGQWVKGFSDITDPVPHMAYHDQSDTDVTSSGKLLGLSCAGNYEFQTGYFDNDTTFAEGDPLISDATAGSLDKGAYADSNAIVGICSQGGRVNLGGTNNAGQNSEATPDNTGAIYVLTFIARWIPASANT